MLSATTPEWHLPYSLVSMACLGAQARPLLLNYSWAGA